MYKYSSVSITRHCPHCDKLLGLTPMASWTDYKPEYPICPYCGTALRLTSVGDLVELHQTTATPMEAQEHK